jgi:branched-chain amino acid transport system permease protein
MQPAGVFAQRYVRDMAIIRTWKQGVALGIFVLALLLVPAALGPRYVAIANIMLITAVVVLGLQITTGLAGQVNLGQAAFMGMGAYTAGALSSGQQWPFLVTVPLAGIVAALFGAIFGLAAVRIRGFYLALTTIAAQFIFVFAVLNLPAAWTGGAQGLRVETATLFGFAFDTDNRMYYLILVITAIMTVGAYGIARSRHGRAFVAVRDDDLAAGFTGVNVVRTKATAFFVGAFYAGVGGALWAYYIRFVAADQFTLFNSVYYMGMIIVGGLGSIAGAFVGVFLIRAAQEILTTYGPSVSDIFPALGSSVVFASVNIVLGAAIALMLILEPRGVMHRVNILKRTYRLWPYPH